MDPNPTIDPITSFHPGTSGKQVTILRRLPYHFPYFIGVVHPITLFLHVQLRKNLFLLFFTPTVAPSFLTVNRWNDHPFFFSDHHHPFFFWITSIDLGRFFGNFWWLWLLRTLGIAISSTLWLSSLRYASCKNGSGTRRPGGNSGIGGTAAVRWICPFWGGGFGGSTRSGLLGEQGWRMTFFSDFCLVCVKKNIPRNDFFVGHGPWKSKSTFFFPWKVLYTVKTKCCFSIRLFWSRTPRDDSFNCRLDFLQSGSPSSSKWFWGPF